MNKVISGKRYNTNSSRLVCAGKTGDNYALLYVKRNGEPFLLDNIDMGAGEIKQIIRRRNCSPRKTTHTTNL